MTTVKMNKNLTEHQKTARATAHSKDHIRPDLERVNKKDYSYTEMNPAPGE